VIGCAGPATFFAMVGLFGLALVLMRAEAGQSRGDPPAHVKIVPRGLIPPYDWEQEGL
jgi:hypothetical protein